MEELSDMYMWSADVLAVEETGKTGGVSVGDFSLADKHEPLDASHGTRIMAKEFKQDNERLKEEIAILKAQCSAKDEEIAHFKDILSAKNEEIADLKEKLSGLQQNRQEKETDFAKQLRTADEELKKTKENIFLAKNILKKKAELEKLPKKRQLFNANDFFDLQPSWFDTLLSSDIGCLEINSYPVHANDLDGKNTDGSSDKPLKPEHSKTNKGIVSPSALFMPVKAAGTPPVAQNKPLPGEGVEAAKVASFETTAVNPFSREAKVESSLLKIQSPLDPVAHFNRAEVKKADNPVSGKDSVDSKKMDDGTCIKINPYRRAKGKVRQVQPPAPLLFVPVKAAVTPPAGQNKPFLEEDAEARMVDKTQTLPLNPFRRATKGKVRQLQHPPPPPPVPPPPPPPPPPSLYMPVKAAVRPPTGQNRPPLGKAVKAKADNSIQSKPENPFSISAKGNGYIHHRPLPFVPVTTVLDGSKMANTYPANAFAQSANPFPHIEQQGFLSRTLSKWFGF